MFRKPNSKRDRLAVGASASVASLWLMPRLQGFVRQSPEVDVSVTTFVERAAIESQNPDLWICNWHTDLDRRIEPLLEEEILPVCSPRLAAEFGPLSFESLRELPLIHVDRGKPEPNGQYPTWERYLREYGIDRRDVAKGARFNQGGPAIEAARAGFGALLGRSILMEEALARGELVQIGEAYPVRNKYYLVSGWRTESRAVDKFRGWLFDQVTASTPHLRAAQ